MEILTYQNNSINDDNTITPSTNTEGKFYRGGDSIPFATPVYQGKNEYPTFPKEKDLKQNKESYFDLSEYTIDQSGLVQENWTTLNIPAQIVEVNDRFVVLECVVDTENMTYEYRKFPKILLEKDILLKSNTLILINIQTRSLNVKIKFIDGRNIINSSYFDDKDLFNDLKGSSLDNPI